MIRQRGRERETLGELWAVEYRYNTNAERVRETLLRTHKGNVGGHLEDTMSRNTSKTDVAWN